MVKRNVCLCEGKYIGIESIFTVINGKQINIPEKVAALRAKSRNNKLFCACGCGAILTLVAGDKNLRKQHFRLKSDFCKVECQFVAEGKISIDSKIVLKCWLDEKLQTNDVETRVPISFIGDVIRKYEFSFLSRTKSIAVSYVYDRANLSDEKFDILLANSNGIRLICIVDKMNGGTNGQYQEALMKIQNRQKYCLFLDAKDSSYADANMSAVFYAKNIDGLWQEIKFADGKLSDYSIAENGDLLYKNEFLSVLLTHHEQAFNDYLQAERLRREEITERQKQREAKSLRNSLARIVAAPKEECTHQQKFQHQRELAKEDIAPLSENEPEPIFSRNKYLCGSKKKLYSLSFDIVVQQGCFSSNYIKVTLGLSDGVTLSVMNALKEMQLIDNSNNSLISKDEWALLKQYYNLK